MLYKIFDTIEEFNTKNAELNTFLGYATDDSQPLEKVTTEVIAEDDSTSVVTTFKLNSREYTEDELKGNPAFVVTDNGYSTAPTIQNYASAIETADGKYAMPILNCVKSQFDENELVDSIEIKQNNDGE